MKQECRPLATLLGSLAVVFLGLGAPVLSSPQQSEPPSRETEKKDESPEKTSETSEPLSSVETPEERREDLDGKLDRSLSEFDGLILREQEILEQRREESAAAGGGGGAGKAGVAGGLEEAGDSEEGSEGTETAEAGTEKGAEGAQEETTGGSPDAPSGEEVAREDAPSDGERGGEPEAGETANGRVPPDVGDGSDDDIVARQLREAAMKEEDPELREKLWDEYRAYKFGQKKKESGT